MIGEAAAITYVVVKVAVACPPVTIAVLAYLWYKSNGAEKEKTA